VISVCGTPVQAAYWIYSRRRPLVQGGEESKDSERIAADAGKMVRFMSAPKFPSALELQFPALADATDRRSAAETEGVVLSLFDECGPALRRYIRSFGLAPAAAEDLIQEIFLALFRHLSLGRPATNLKGWLFQVAHNLALKHRLHAQRRAHTEDPWDTALLETVADRAANPEELFFDLAQSRELAVIYDALPERERRCLFLRAEGLTYREIGRALGISLGSVANSLVRAFSRLSPARLE
jgi:RNA polymerase sigma-70 factor, ECF subfamily